jgi:hypothetical protein
MLAGSTQKSVVYLAAALLVGTLIFFLSSCSKKAKRPFDPKSGIVSRDHQLAQEVLTPIDVRIDSDYKFYYTEDHLVFVSGVGQPERMLSVHLGRGLRDNRYLRAERDFFGFLYDGEGMQGLAYTKMRHDSTRLEASYDFYTFGGLTWDKPYQSGNFHYDRRGVKFRMEFSNLVPVQSFANRDWRLRANAFGDAKLIMGNDTIPGFAYYELIQLEGYNPMANVNKGIDYINYDWIALRTASGKQLLISTDSSTANDLLMKDFVAFDHDDVYWYADGSDNVDMISSDIFRDRKIHDWLANSKRVEVPDLGMTVTLKLSDARVFYTNGYAIALVSGILKLESGEEKVWGVLEHRQQPGSTSEALK